MKTDYIFFWGGCFSNWYPCKFTMDYVEFSSSEQAFMCEKALFFEDEEADAKILATNSPSEQKAIGRTIKNFDAEKWSEVSKSIMYEVCKAKFTQNPHLLKALLATEGKTLVEASPFDKIYGIGLDKNNPLAWEKETWEGENLLGYILTELRDNIIKESKI